MAILTTNKTLFGAAGASNTEVFKPYAGVSRTIDFGKSDVSVGAGATVNFEFIPLPEAFVVTGIYLEEMEKLAAGVKVGLAAKSDSAALGSAVDVGGTDVAKSVQNITSKALADGDMICLTVQNSGSAEAKIDSGVIKVCIIGYLPNGDSLANFRLDTPYRSSNQTAGENASKGDLLTQRD